MAGSTTAGSTIKLRASSTTNVVSEMGGAFKNGSKCDADGNLYIRKQAMDRPLLGPVVKINPDGKRTALFDPAAFSQLGLDRADAFSPASDGGIYQIASQMLQSPDGHLKQRIYVLHFASDGSASAPTLLDADFEVYTFAAFAGGSFLVSGVRRDALNKNDHGRNFTAVFSADGRELAQLSFPKPSGSARAGTKSDGPPNSSRNESLNDNDAEPAAPTLDLADAEVGREGNLYVMRASSPALIYVIAPSGQIMKTLKIAGPADAVANGFHVSGNRLAMSFWSEDGENQMMVVADAQTGRKIASYSDSSELGPSFACYSADEGVFTFLRLGEGNSLEVIRAQPE
jgi:hypothetical protein